MPFVEIVCHNNVLKIKNSDNMHYNKPGSATWTFVKTRGGRTKRLAQRRRIGDKTLSVFVELLIVQSSNQNANIFSAKKPTNDQEPDVR